MNARLVASVLVVLCAAACASTETAPSSSDSPAPSSAGAVAGSGDRGSRTVRYESAGVPAAAPMPAPAPAPAAAHRHGANPGTPDDTDNFKRSGPGCACPSDPHLGDCKCMHCGDKPGAQCYCQQGKPSCLCGIDMPSCSCIHCAGRPGKECEVCPCDHTATRARLGIK